MTEIVISGAKRTPLGAFQGELSSLRATDLGAASISAALSDAKIAPESIDETVPIRLSPTPTICMAWRRVAREGDKAGMDVSQREDLSFPRSLPEFQRLFPDGTACAA